MRRRGSEKALVARCRVSPEQALFLENKMIEWSELRPLYSRLLELDGCYVAPQLEEDLAKILDRGEAFDGRGAELRRMARSRCHNNSAALWGSDDKKYAIATGWALSDDGVWRQHSWALEGDRVIETTERRKLYYGFRLRPDEAEVFYWNNCT